MKKLLAFLLLSWLALQTGHGQTISPYLAGQNAWLPKAYGGVTYNGLLEQLWPVVQRSHVQMVRIGGNGVEFNMPSGPEYVALIDSIRRIGAEPMVQVAQGRGKYTAQQAADLVAYVNQTMNRHVKYWIIGNEPNLAGTRTTVPVAGVEAYIKAWSSAMKAVDPNILIIGPETSFYDTSYLNPLIGGANDITGQDANGRYYVDIVSFHSYPFSGTQTRAQVVAGAQIIAGNVDRLLTLLSAANSLHNRTGAHALQWAVTEFNLDYANPAANTVEGVGVHSFLNGQYWAEVFGVGMQKGAVSMLPWSIHEGSGARGTGDLGYLDGSTLATIKPRSAYYHEQLVADNLRGTYLAASDNQSLVTVLAAARPDRSTAVMLLNKSDASDYDFTVQLSAATVPGAASLKVNVPAGLAAAYSDKLFAQSTLVLLFDSQGALTQKIVYSLQHAAATRPPTYLRPGQSTTLVTFAADKTFSCIAPEAVTYTASVLGDYSALSWQFGTDATPQTATGKGPIAVTYATAGLKTTTLTLASADTTLVVSKPDYVQVSACVRTPYTGTAAVIPGVIKAVEYDTGGEGVAYHDADPTNRGAALDPTVPRPDEGVDTENGGEGNGNVGYSASGEWLKYTVRVLRSGLYKVVARVSANAAGGALRVSVNDVDKTGVVPVPASGGFGTYQDVIINNVYLDAASTATLKFDLVSASFNVEKLTFTEQAATGIVVNRLYNATATVDGSQDAVELLVVQDHTDIRGLIIKDFENNLTTDTGGKYQFRDQALWRDLRLGTTVVLRRLAGPSGYAQDVDATDFTLDVLLDNGTYLANLSGSGQSFNLTQTDMVLLKSGAAEGTAAVVHTFATNGGGNTALYNAVTTNKLTATAANGTGTLLYPTNPSQSPADYAGTAAAAATGTTEATRTWGYGYGAANTTYINTLRNAVYNAPSIVVNRVYNGSNDNLGTADAVELLVVQDHLDLRNLVVKDFETNNTADTGGKYSFANTAFWQDVRSGTTIVLRQLAGPAGYVQDTDPTDFTLDLLLGNTTYLTKQGSGTFNITQYDMVLLKTGLATGTDGAIHAFATKGGGSAGVPSALFLAVRSAKLTSPDGTDAGGGSFHYPLNASQRVSDYNGAGGAISKSTDFNWGYGFGAANVAYIQSLRDAVAPADLVVASGQRLGASGTYATITVQDGGSLALRGPTAVSGAVLVQAGGVLATNCQPLTGAGSFELQAGAELQICEPAGLAADNAAGAVQLAGTRTLPPGALYTYNGTAAQVTGAGLPSQVRGLTVNNAAGLTLSQDLSISQLARLQSGNLRTGGQALTLLSSAEGTALLDNTGGVVVGNGTMQRAITGGAAGAAYRHFSSPVVGATWASLATADFAPTFNATYNASAAPGATVPFPTVFGYDENRLATTTSDYAGFDKGWFSPVGASEVLPPLRGYTVHLSAPAAPLAFTGPFNNATQSTGPLSRGSDADAGWQLLGNPYPSPLDWRTVSANQRPGLDAAVYVFESTGPYAGTYRSYANGIGASPLLAAGTGFFVRVSAANTPGSLTLTNANRVTTFAAQPAFGRPAADARPQLRLLLSGSGGTDETLVYLESGATTGADAQYDATKLANPSGLSLASLAGGTALAINGLPPLAATETVLPLAVQVPRAGSYALEVADLAGFGGGTVYLRDAQTGTQQPLAAGSRYSFTLAAAAAGSGRFSLVLRPAAALAAQPSLSAATVGLYPNPAHGSFTVLLPPLAGQRTVRASLLNVLGQVVLTRTIALTPAGATATIGTAALAAGVYTLRLQGDNQQATRRVVVE